MALRLATPADDRSIAQDLGGFFDLKAETVTLEIPRMIANQPGYVDRLGWTTNQEPVVDTKLLRGIFTTALQIKAWGAGRHEFQRKMEGWLDTNDALVEFRLEDLSCEGVTLTHQMRILRGSDRFLIDHLEYSRHLVIAILNQEPLAV